MSVFGVITHQYLPFLARAVSKYFLKHLDCTSHKSVELQSNLKHSGNFFTGNTSDLWKTNTVRCDVLAT